jgi:hypothetical protein
MRESLLEALVELLTVGIELLLAVGLTVAGVLSEQVGLETVTTTGEAIGYWYIYVGFVAFYLGLYLVGYDRLLPRLAQLRQDA